MRTIFSEVVSIGRTRALALGVAVSTALVLCVLVLVAVQPAEAAFPGKNGKIAFVSNRDVGGGEIYTIGPNGGAATRITFPTGGSATPAYSPDGSKIAFMKGNHIFVMNASGMKSDGTGATQITSPGTINKEPTWSPDGTKIAYVVQEADYEIYIINADGTGTPQRLTDNSYPDTQPAWSPLGDQIAFVSAHTGLHEPIRDTDRNLYVMDANPATNDVALNLTPNTSTPVYQGHDEDPSWSPAGQWIAYSNGMSGVDIWKIRPDGTGKTSIAAGDDEKTDPAWSPDGTKIAYVGATSSTDRDIWVMNVDGSNPKILHDDTSHDINPDWQEDSIPPDTTITSGPPSITRSTSASFTFAFSESGSSFQCSLDDSAFTACQSYTGLTNGVHTFRVQATDAAGNVDLTPAARSWRVDTQRPSGRVVINGGSASTTKRTVTLKLNATDPAPASGVSHMRFKNNGSTAWSGWQAYATSKSWALSTGAGKKTVYVQYKDRAGNLSAVATDSIMYRP